MRSFSKLSKILLIILLFAACFGCAEQGISPDEFLARNVVVDGKSYGYRVFVPKNRNQNEKLPAMLYLHGSGARGDDNIAQIDSIRWAITPIEGKIGFIIVAPQCRNETFWADSEMAKYALTALDDAVKEFDGDQSRLYLTGFSLGGYGTWQIAAANPGKFAALMPVAGGVVGERPIEPRDRAAIIPVVGEMLDSAEPYKEVAKAIGQTPVWVFHGSADDAVPVEYARKIVQALKDAGNSRVKYTEYDGDKHQIFGKAFAEPGFLEWLSDQKLDDKK